MLLTLLYGSECWTPLHCHLKRLDSFHQRCVKAALKITTKQQWEQHITSVMVRQHWIDEETIATKPRQRRLEGLGRVARMTDHCLPRICLFGGWLKCDQFITLNKGGDTLRCLTYILWELVMGVGAPWQKIGGSGRNYVFSVQMTNRAILR